MLSDGKYGEKLSMWAISMLSVAVAKKCYEQSDYTEAGICLVLSLGCGLQLCNI